MNPGDPPLTGLRVLDLSRVLAGPYCTMMLADLGAEVIKVEQPGAGDETRGWGPPFVGADAAYFIAVNRSKRSVALDLKDPADRESALALAARCDVVIQNFRPGTIERLGFGYEDLRSLRPGLVYCSLTGFGSDRQPPDRAGYDFIGQAESGLMHITGSDEPTKVGVAVVDILAGMNAAVAILAALRRRDHTGEGEHIEVSLLDSGLAVLINVAQAALLTGEEARRYGNAHPHIVPYETFEASDGWVAVAAANDRLYRRLCDAIGLPELAQDERFVKNVDRVINRDQLTGLLARRFRERTTDEWVEALDAAGVPVGKVRGVLEALAAAEAAGRSATAAVPHPAVGEIRLVSSPIRLTEAPLRPPQAPPLLGEHTAEIAGDTESAS
ncbi:MAG TPA: CoA transferase [Solirubrobacteraceae bacterium]|jgi:crotonobetainyl-CoA:carnitine CoA-transferase CaiB-like acyl-CoA transferase|nr:CoA transferase [Solirubrobacteraceae bacterium]